MVLTALMFVLPYAPGHELVFLFCMPEHDYEWYLLVEYDQRFLKFCHQVENFVSNLVWSTFVLSAVEDDFAFMLNEWWMNRSTVHFVVFLNLVRYFCISRNREDSDPSAFRTNQRPFKFFIQNKWMHDSQMEKLKTRLKFLKKVFYLLFKKTPIIYHL